MFNKDDYKSSLPALLNHYRKYGFSEMSLFSALTGVPILVVYELLMDNIPQEKENCEKRIKEIKIFFGYK